jgi:hypothetical protein
MERSCAVPDVERVGGDGVIAFYDVRLGRKSWMAVLAAGDDRWYRFYRIVRTC